MSNETILLFELMLMLIESLVGKRSTSKNSSLPPSLDPFRAKVPRAKGKNKQGGQLGHRGSTIRPQFKASSTIVHPLGTCDECNYNLAGGKGAYTTRHQEIDVSYKLVVTEHIVEHAVCRCGHHQCDDIGKNAPVQYGAGLKATAVELNLIQCISVARTAKFLQEKFKISVSSSSLINFSKLASERILMWEEHAKDELLKSDKLHCDETGINMDAQIIWAHAVSNDKFTLIIPHEKRGEVAIDDCGILKKFNGYLSHDFWA